MFTDIKLLPFSSVSLKSVIKVHFNVNAEYGTAISLLNFVCFKICMNLNNSYSGGICVEQM